MGVMSWDLDGGPTLFRIIGDRRTIQPTLCHRSIMDDEGPKPVVPEEKESGLAAIDRIRETALDGIDDFSDRELIQKLHLSKSDYRNVYEFELQRRFVDRLTKAMAGGTIAAWALVAGTFILGVATILLVIAAW